MTRTHLKKIFKYAAVLVFVCTLGAYTYIKAENLINGPQLTLTSPALSETKSDQLLKVQGKAVNVSYISLNDRPIFIDELGNFNEVVLLSPGYNALLLKARDKFGREISKKMELVYEGN